MIAEPPYFNAKKMDVFHHTICPQNLHKAAAAVQFVSRYLLIYEIELDSLRAQTANCKYSKLKEETPQ